MDQPLPNANVIIKGTTVGTRTDTKGKYSIEAYSGNILVFSYLGMQTIEVPVDDMNNVLDIKLSEHLEELNEVVVKKRRRKGQKELMADYTTNSNLIKTSWGILDKDRTSYSIQVIEGKDLIPIGIDFLVSLQTLLPNMLIDREDTPLNPKVYFQQYGREKVPAIFDVDGFVYEQAPTFIGVHEIERVAVLPRNGAFARYGPSGAGGVIIINTKEQTRIDELGINRTYSNSGLRDSIYDQLSIKQAYVPEVPKYIEEYNFADSEIMADQLFKKQRKRYENSPFYFLDMSEYYRTRWGNTNKSLQLLDSMGLQFKDDAVALKVLAYRYEKLELRNKALQQYLRVLKIKSRAAQSHRDLANAYNEIGNFQKALHIYTRYELAVKELDTIPFDAEGTDRLITTEKDNIISLNDKRLLLETDVLQKRFEYPKTRVLFEWNNNTAEFELQFVDPEQYYNSWEYTFDTKESQLSAEILKGYSSKEFFLDDDLKGEWVVNISYFGNGTQDPTYLKVSTFFDYGTSVQRKVIKVFKLNKIKEDTYLCKINTESKLFIE
jgi:tetratricopeptide (TPR) repeat protein